MPRSSGTSAGHELFHPDPLDRIRTTLYYGNGGFDMKSEVIDKILSVEENAQTIRDEAEEKARNIVLDAQSESARIVKEALAEERKRGDELVADASRLLDEKLRKIDEEMKALESCEIDVDRDSVIRARDKIVSLVCSTSLSGE